MDKLRVGVVGLHRGKAMIQYLLRASNAELVALCEIRPERLEKVKNELHDPSIGCYSDYAEFLEHPMDAVVLANYATEHAPLAICALDKGLHVFSEVMPCRTMAEAVQLIEAVERSKAKYCYLEDFCYMPVNMEMRSLYLQGKLGEFRYGEGEYIHNCETLWPDITYGDPTHWRNNVHACFYCSHSVGPLLHATGLRPVSVTGFELPHTNLIFRCGAKRGSAAIEMVTMENGGVIKSIHGGLYRNSEWFCLNGEKGRIESAREDADQGGASRVYLNVDPYEGAYAPEPVISYRPTQPDHWDSNGFQHHRADYYCMWHAVEHVLGNPDAHIVDVYEAVDMFMVGHFAYYSVLDGGKPQTIPDLRDPAQREAFRNDHHCTDPKIAGDQLLPCYSKGNPEIPDIVYQAVREKWLQHQQEGR